MPDGAETNPLALVPLDVAAEVIRQKVYSDRLPGWSSSEQLLDSIAATISVVATIYEYRPSDSVTAKALSRVELNGGMFKGGAKELRFNDGRPARRPLAIAAADIAEIIEALKGATGSP